MEEEGTALILEGGKDTIPKSVPLREPILAGVIQQSDQEIFPFFAHEIIFSHAQNSVGFLGAVESPVPTDLPCCLFYERNAMLFASR